MGGVGARNVGGLDPNALWKATRQQQQRQPDRERLRPWGESHGEPRGAERAKRRHEAPVRTRPAERVGDRSQRQRRQQRQQQQRRRSQTGGPLCARTPAGTCQRARSPKRSLP
ncbi:unnamed protein product [Lampetra planeri]